MITRKPEPGDKLDYLQMSGGWVPYGTIKRVDGALCWVQDKSAPVLWCFGRDGCLGGNVCFRIVGTDPDAPATRQESFKRAASMADPEFN